MLQEPDSPSEIEIRDLELGVYYYRVRAIIANDGSSDDSKTVRVSLFKESLDFSDKKPITNPSYVPHNLIIQDMDGDGDKDIISASRNYASLQDNRFNYHEQEGIKTLLFDNEGKSIKKNYRARRIIAYDILGDSNPEIISFPTRDGVGNNKNGGAFIFQKTGNIFNSMPIDNDNFSHTFSLYDINNDGEADIITTNNSRLSFYLGEGNSMFSEERIITTIENNYNFGTTLRDIDDDGDIDIMSYLYKDGDIPSADYVGDFFVLYENLGNNFFVERRIFTPIPGRSIVNNRYSIADMNNDGKKDIVCMTIKHFVGLDGSVYLYKQGDNLSFSDPIVVIEEGSSISGVSAIDMNEDGSLDLLFANPKLKVYINEGDGESFFKQKEISSKNTVITRIIDMDDDGIEDIVLSEVTASRPLGQVYNDLGRLVWNKGDIVYSPIALPAVSIELNSFKAKWDTVTKAEKYYLDVSLDKEFSNKLSNYDNVEVNNIEEMTIDIGIESGNTYYYRLVSEGAFENLSPYSNYIEVRTPLAIPSDPVVLEAVEIEHDAFKLRWQESENAEYYTIDLATDMSFTSIVSFYSSYKLKKTEIEVDTKL